MGDGFVVEADIRKGNSAPGRMAALSYLETLAIEKIHRIEEQKQTCSASVVTDLRH